MLEFLRSLFRPDARRREESPQAEQARKLEMDEPMAGAGALLSGEHPRETEKI